MSLADQIHAAKTVVGKWCTGLVVGHPVEWMIWEDVSSSAVRISFRHIASRKAAVVMVEPMMLLNADMAPLWLNLQAALCEVLIQPPRDGGAFTQDDAIKLSGVRDVSKARRVRRG